MSAGAITLLVDDPGWRKTRGLTARLRRAAEAALRSCGLSGKSALTVLLASDDRLRDLNRDFRAKDKPTNVLSFPNGRTAGRSCVATAYATATRSKKLRVRYAGAIELLADAPDYLGDIAIAYGVTRREAEESGKRFADHACHLVVHGVLHLAGYDHERPADARVMEPLEVKILGRLGIADPYKMAAE